MSKNRIFFLVAFGLYHLIAFLFVYYVDNQKENIGLLTELHKSIYLFKYGTFIGIILFIVDAVWSWRSTAILHRDQEELQSELNKIKAKMYDLIEKDEPKVSVEADPDSE